MINKHVTFQFFLDRKLQLTETAGKRSLLGVQSQVPLQVLDTLKRLVTIIADVCAFIQMRLLVPLEEAWLRKTRRTEAALVATLLQRRVTSVRVVE